VEPSEAQGEECLGGIYPNQTGSPVSAAGILGVLLPLRSSRE
jgi:hypothetical protein